IDRVSVLQAGRVGGKIRTIQQWPASVLIAVQVADEAHHVFGRVLVHGRIEAGPDYDGGIRSIADDNECASQQEGTPCGEVALMCEMDPIDAGSHEQYRNHNHPSAKRQTHRIDKEQFELSGERGNSWTDQVING